MSLHDPRLTPVRGELASAKLEGLVAARAYVQPATVQLHAAATAIRREPRAGAEQVDQLLFGERFEILHAEEDGWAFGQAERDGYVGYVETGELKTVGRAPTHWVSALRTFAFEAPSLKAAPVACLSMNALVSIQEQDRRFARVDGSGWIAVDHLSALGDWQDDPATVSELYLGAPYLWGGRDSLGLDCSGLVQQALYACGRAGPRDSDMQASLGQAVPAGGGLPELQRNDLVFWPGHVGVMLDPQTLLHANAHHMAVSREPLEAAVARIDAAGGGRPTTFRRLGRCN